MKHLQVLALDKKLAPALSAPIKLPKKQRNLPLRLMSAIISQQLNTRVAKIIYERFLTMFGGLEPLPHQVLEVSDADLRAIGLSASKVCYIKNVAAFWIDNDLTDKKIDALGNEEIIELLSKIKGVGRWTVEMLLMFTLGRSDVFAADDLGIQKAMTALYGLEKLSKKDLKKKMMALSKRWHPYQSYACLYLWSWKDNTPVK